MFLLQHTFKNEKKIEINTSATHAYLVFIFKRALGISKYSVDIGSGSHDRAHGELFVSKLNLSMKLIFIPLSLTRMPFYRLFIDDI